MFMKDISKQREITNRWIQTVDPMTSAQDRAELERLFRRDVAQAQREARILNLPYIDDLEHVPQGVIAVVVMCAAYQGGLYLFGELKSLGKTDDIVRVGHSTWSHSGWKYFPDGTLMGSHELYPG